MEKENEQKKWQMNKKKKSVIYEKPTPAKSSRANLFSTWSNELFKLSNICSTFLISILSLENTNSLKSKVELTNFLQYLPADDHESIATSWPLILPFLPFFFFSSLF
jgi:hypothetical protein